jgi:hypothetical protein
MAPEKKSPARRTRGLKSRDDQQRQRSARLVRNVLAKLERLGCEFAGNVLPQHRRLSWELDRLEAGMPTVRAAA